MTSQTTVRKLAAQCKAAAHKLTKADTHQKNEFLHKLKNNLLKNKELILKSNQDDILEAAINGLNDAMIDRLSLQNRLESIIHDIEQVIYLPDPIGTHYDERQLTNGLSLSKHRTPLGVLGIIYESRPNVTIDITSLAIKSGNCAILRGGSETLRTNQSLIKVIHNSLIETGLPCEAIQLINNTNREEVKELLKLHEYVDLIIPRGSHALQQFCREHSTIPVITGGIGICHLYVDESADLEKSLPVICNAKTQRPTVCNALDTLLVHANKASQFIPLVVNTLAEAGVEFRMDPKAHEYSQGVFCQPAGPHDWDTEWLSLVLGIKVVENMDEAIKHIQEHSSGHSDGILTEKTDHAAQFVREVDSAAVYVNASTRFTDGAQFGLGGEVAISTQKLHARGPMGLNELTSYKWVVHGNYQIRT